MKPTASDPATTFFLPSLPSYDCTLSLLIDAQVIQSKTARRAFYDPTLVSARQVQEDGVIGTYFAPNSAQPTHPALIYVGGIEGGISPYIAATLSHYGLTTLALGYIGNSSYPVPGLPQNLVDIPIETVGNAAHWLARQPGVDSNQLYVFGYSRGSELTQLAALADPGAFRKIILYSPSSTAWFGTPQGWPFAMPAGAWTWNGAEIPYAQGIFWPIDFAAGAPYSYFDGFSRALDAMPFGAPAHLPDSRITASMLLVSGGQDKVWPSSRMAETIKSERDAAGMTGMTRHIHFSGAGHYLNLPFIPDRISSMMGIQLGGSAAPNAQASEQAWAEVLSFLKP
jgi:dienelactone hydrolase